MNLKLKDLIETKRVIVCCGSGGVGKTTLSAALGIAAALLGKRVVVVTIDPAKRLATSLGLKNLSATATDLSPLLIEATGGSVKGKISALMPDTAQTFETFVKQMAGTNEHLVKKLFGTSIYKAFTKDFAGTNEYMAMEKMYELYQNPNYDLVILDTPPSPNTRLFLEAPHLFVDFFDEKMVKWFINPGSKIIASGIKKLLEILEKLTGKGFVSDLFDFTLSLFELRTQFVENLKKVGELLHQDNVAFLMVTSPERLSKEDTIDFVSLLNELNYPFWGFIVNRTLSLKLGIKDSQELQNTQNFQALSKDEKNLVLKNFEFIFKKLEKEKEVENFLSSCTTKNNTVLIPEQSDDIHNIQTLLKIVPHLIKV